MTMEATASNIGKSGTFNVPLKGAGDEGFVIPIRVIDERKQCGRTDVKIEPTNGTGSAWIKLSNIKLD